jgi:hypothetical protein
VERVIKCGGFDAPARADTALFHWRLYWLKAMRLKEQIKSYEKSVRARGGRNHRAVAAIGPVVGDTVFISQTFWRCIDGQRPAGSHLPCSRPILAGTDPRSRAMMPSSAFIIRTRRIGRNVDNPSVPILPPESQGTSRTSEPMIDRD